MINADSDIKMSEAFDLPTTAAAFWLASVAGDNGRKRKQQMKALTHAINTHDTLVAQNLALKAALEKVLEISGGSNEQNMANFDDELASQHNDDINEVYKLVKALEGVGDE